MRAMHIEDAHYKDAQPCRFAEPTGQIFTVLRSPQLGTVRGGETHRAGPAAGAAGPALCCLTERYFRSCAEIPVVAVPAVTVTMVADFSLDLWFHH